MTVSVSEGELMMLLGVLAGEVGPETYCGLLRAAPSIKAALDQRWGEDVCASIGEDEG